MAPASTILLVEDDGADADLVRTAVAETGLPIDLDVAGGGIPALDYLHGRSPWEGRSRPDLVLLDLALPDIDGRDVLRHVKADTDLRVIPVIAMSSAVDGRSVVDLYARHANAVIAKPPTFDDLVRAIGAIHAFWLDTARPPFA